VVEEFDGQVAQASTPTQLLASTNYLAYSKDAVDTAVAEGKRVAVFFHSKTCGSCAKLDGDIEANEADIPSDVVIFKTDWDDNQDLAQEYKVDKYHTITYVTTN
jgi:thiol-disulfide isomerase/thioredoxin